MSRNQVSRVSGFLGLALLLLTPALSFARVVGQGRVIDVNWSDSENPTEFVPVQGDKVAGGVKALTQAGMPCNLILVTGNHHDALFIAFLGNGNERPPLEETLAHLDTAVTSVRDDSKPILKGDTVRISTQTLEGGKVGVTLDVFREAMSVGSFSFVQDH